MKNLNDDIKKSLNHVLLWNKKSKLYVYKRFIKMQDYDSLNYVSQNWDTKS